MMGRIWLHRPFQVMPTASSNSSSSPLPQPSIVHCPLPKRTPSSTSENKLQYLSSQSKRALAEIQQSKAEFYKRQFAKRVSKDDAEGRIQRRTVRLANSLREVHVTVYYPEKVGSDIDNATKLRGICLHVHGGGWLWGDSHDQVAHRCLEMSKRLNAAVVSVDYSLLEGDAQSTFKGNANEAKDVDNLQAFDPVNDVITVIDWIESAGAGELNADTSYVASGESSGAHLLLLAMLHRRDRVDTSLSHNISSAWKCLSLVYGVYDLSGTPSIRGDGKSSSPLCGDDLLWLYDLYCTNVVRGAIKTDGTLSNADRMHPSTSPLYANLSNLPPALLTVGSADPLLDDTLFMANKYSSFGNHVELVIAEGGEHGVGHFGVQEDEEMGVWIRNHTTEFLLRYLKGYSHSLVTA